MTIYDNSEPLDVEIEEGEFTEVQRARMETALKLGYVLLLHRDEDGSYYVGAAKDDDA